MAKSFSPRQRGFTLIEMSIVLVIIGLIIGGILKGQELVESARQKNMISQVDSVKSGITTFIDRFKSYPGDYGRATTTLNANAANGNEDGNVGAINAAVANLATLVNLITGENEQFFSHLIAAELLGGGTVAPVGTATTGFSGNVTVPSPQPSSAFPQSGLSIQFGTHQGTAASPGSSVQSHWLIVSRWKNAALVGGPTDGIISPARAFQLDNKYDDGIAWEGNIRTLGTLTNGTGCGATAATYTFTLTDVNCHLVFNTK